MPRARLLVLAFLVLPTLGADTRLDTYPRRTGIDVDNYRFEITLRDDPDLKSVVQGMSVDLGGRRHIKIKKLTAF